MAIYDNRVCRACGVIFSGGPRAWYCPDCRLERQRERGRYYSAHGYSRHIGDTDVCENCGAKYTVESGQQKYCKNCRDEMHRQLDNRQGVKYYHRMDNVTRARRTARRRELYPANKDALNAARRATRLGGNCRHCDAPIRRGNYCADCRREILAIYDATHAPSKLAAEYGCNVNYIYFLLRKRKEG